MQEEIEDLLEVYYEIHDVSNLRRPARRKNILRRLYESLVDGNGKKKRKT